MSDELPKPDVSKPRLAKPLSMTVVRETTYRVSKAQSMRMRAHDKKVEATEAKRAKAAAAERAKLEENGVKTGDASRSEV